MKKLVFLCMVLLLCVTCVHAKPVSEGRIVQTYVNCTIIIEDYIKTQNGLYGLVKQYNGNLTNFDFNQQNGTGNATVQINPDKLSSFLSDMKILGQIESTNFSTSDYTNDYYNYKKRLEAYKKLSDIYPPVIEKLNLSGDDRIYLQGELSQLVNSQISSLKNSMAGYEQYNNYTQVSIQIRYARNGQGQCGIQIDKTSEIKVPAEKSILNNSGLIILFVLITGNIFLTLYLLNKIKKSPHFS
ncbi:MAG: DUF4349 domain-containing protein [Candidatus Eremiobacterota bacterium]